jgi:hypothetical protein
MSDTERTKFRPVRNSGREGKPERASAGQAVTPMKFGRVRISSAERDSAIEEDRVLLDGARADVSPERGRATPWNR